MKYNLGFLMLAAAFAAGTVAVGWWAVPIIGAAWGLAAAPDKRPARVAAASAAMGWAALLIVAMMGGPAMKVAEAVGAIMRVGTAGFVLLTLLFPLVLAASAAGVTSAFRAKRV